MPKKFRPRTRGHAKSQVRKLARMAIRRTLPGPYPVSHDPTDSRSPYFRNTPLKDGNPNSIIGLAEEKNSNPIGG